MLPDTTPSDGLDQTRQSLLLRLAQQGGDAWAEFVAIYEQAIVQYCRTRGLQHADAQDASQKVLLAVHDKVGHWERESGRGNFRAWLFRVARNAAIDEIRRRSRNARVGGDTVEQEALERVPQSDPSETDSFRLEYRRALFQWAAEQVRPEVRESTWQAFWLTAVDRRPPERVAKELSLSVGAVYTAKCRVVARLKEKAAEVDEHNDDSIAMIKMPNHTD